MLQNETQQKKKKKGYQCVIRIVQATYHTSTLSHQELEGIIFKIIND